MGLVLRLKKGDTLKLGENIYIEIVLDTNKKLSLHIVAPQDVKIKASRGKDDERSDS